LDRIVFFISNTESRLVGSHTLKLSYMDKYYNEMVNHENRYYHKPKGKDNELLTLAGVKYLLLEVAGLTYEEWKEFIEIRNIIVHGISPLESIKELVKNCTLKLENALITGIFDCIGIEHEKIPYLLRPIYYPSSKTEQRIFLKLHNSDFLLL
jgi:hypothetical protein